MNTIKYVNAMMLVTAIGFGNVQAAGTREIEALNQSKVSLARATQIAEKQEQGKTISAEFDMEKNQPLWEVKVLGAKGVKQYKIDAMTETVVKIEDEHIWGRLTNFVTGINLKDLENTKTSLVQAIDTAEKRVKGKAVKAEVEHEHNSLQYKVFLRSDSKTEKVKIDAATGQVL